MKKGEIVYLVVIICFIFVSLFLFIENHQLKIENNLLVNKSNSQGNVSNDYEKNKDTDLGERKNDDKGTDDLEITVKDNKNPGEREVKIKSGFKIEVFENGTEFSNIPAYGPLCTLNVYGINHTNAVKIIGRENDYLTRISIEGVIPTWAIESDDNYSIGYVGNEIMYILSECNVFLTPEEESKKIFTAQRGKAVTVSAEYEDWYFITMNYNMDPNTLHYGWVKKSSLGYYDDFDSNIGLDVNIKKGSPIKYSEEGETEIINSSTEWGQIVEETDNEYILRMPGASFIIVEKKYVEPFSRRKQ